MVKKDRSLRALADGEDGERLEPLLDFRERLREVSEGTAYRSDRRRNGQPGVGPLTLDTRKMLLDELLVVQGEVGQQLISPREIELIREQWERDGQRITLSPEELAFEDPIKTPAVPLLQGGREYWQTSVTFADLVRICDMPAERPDSASRYQRDASWSRAGEISRYIRNNRDSYTLPPVVVCSDSCSYSDADRTLTFRPGGQVLLVDGQHRRAAIEMALERDRTLETESIGVVVYPYEDITRARQLFSDLNSGKPIPKSVQVFMDRRASSPALVAMEQAPFSGWIEPVKTGLSSRSPYLWTLSALAQCPHLEDAGWWTSALHSLPGFLDVIAGRLSPAQARQRYVWAHGVGLRAIGESRSRISSPEMLSVVAWERKDPRWEGVASQKGKMLASNSSQVADEIVSQVLAASAPFDIDW